MVKCIIQLRKINKSHLFAPYLYGSQACESLFRQVRSLSTTYSTVTNCSVKEITERISKIQMQNDIMTRNADDYVFPRNCDANEPRKIFDLPSIEEIVYEIEQAKKHSVNNAICLGLLKHSKINNFDFSCRINPCNDVIRKKSKKKTEDRFEGRSIKIEYEFDKLALKNFAYQFDDEVIDDISPFVEIFYDKYAKLRVVVKKTSLIWLLSNDPLRVSTDRLERVKDKTRIKLKKKLSFQFMGSTKKRKKVK